MDVMDGICPDPVAYFCTLYQFSLRPLVYPSNGEGEQIMIEKIFILTVLIEAVIESVKMFVEEFAWELVAAFVLGVGGVFLFGVNLFSLLGIEVVVGAPYDLAISAVLVGLLLVRFSGAANGLMDFLQNLKPGQY